MKKLLVLLAMAMAFTWTAAAQTSSSSSTGQTSDQATSTGQTSDQTTTSKSKSKKSASSDQMGAMDQTGATSDTGKKHGKAKKEATLTGCLSAQADPSGNFTLSNAKHKQGVKVEPADKIKEHAGHQVALKGQWKGTGADKAFEVASLKHMSDTCEMAPGGGTAGMTKKGKKDTSKGKDTGATPPKQ